jgi:hypothetical protein
VSPKKLEKMQCKIDQLIDNDNTTKSIMDIISEVLNYSDSTHEIYAQNVKDNIKAMRNRNKEKGVSTYTESARNYYEKNKEHLNEQRGIKMALKRAELKNNI